MRRWLTAAAVLALATAIVPAPALADPAAATPPSAPDTVFLTNGGRLRGVVMEEDPKTGVRIKLLDGTVRAVPAKEVKSVTYASKPEPPPAPPAVAASAPPAPPAASVVVHVDSKSDVDLQRRDDATDHWKTVCSSPCDESVPRNGSYRIAGSGVKPSRPFPIDDADAKGVVIAAKPARKGAFVGGIVVLAGGIVILGIGTAGAIAVGTSKHEDIGASCTGSSSSNNTACGSNNALFAAFIAIAVSGAVIAGSGGVMMATNASTKAVVRPVETGALERALPASTSLSVLEGSF